MPCTGTSSRARQCVGPAIPAPACTWSRPGNFVGEAAPLTGEPRSATVLARVPSDVVELPHEAFLDVAERHPMLLAKLAGLVSQRLVARTSRHGLSDRHETAAVILDAHTFRAS